MMFTVPDFFKKVLSPRVRARRNLAAELRWGEPELRLLPKICDRNKTFLDVGANWGSYSLLGARYSSAVYAIEAHPEMATLLKKALGRKATVLAAAASDKASFGCLAVPVIAGRDLHTRSSLEDGANPGMATRRVAVRRVPIDALNLSGVGVMKIDVEGHELAVLAGARGLIADERPVVIIECEERHHEGGVQRMREFFSTLEYVGFFLHDGSSHRLEMFDLALQAPSSVKKVDGDRSRDYVNNFLFVHRGDPRLSLICDFTY